MKGAWAQWSAPWAVHWMRLGGNLGTGDEDGNGLATQSCMMSDVISFQGCGPRRARGPTGNASYLLDIATIVGREEVVTWFGIIDSLTLHV